MNSVVGQMKSVKRSSDHSVIALLPAKSHTRQSNFLKQIGLVDTCCCAGLAFQFALLLASLAASMAAASVWDDGGDDDVELDGEAKRAKIDPALLTCELCSRKFGDRQLIVMHCASDC